jgi:hypothetical protein
LNATNGTVPDGTLYSVWDGTTWLPATAPITGTLTNVTASVQSTTYQVQPSVNGCVGQTFSATVFVTPIPSVNAIALTTCSGVSFGITPVNGTNGLVPIGTQYTWLLPTGTGFTGGVSQSLGVNNFTGNLTNLTSSVVTATYQLQNSYLGCNGNTFTVTVSVYPVAAINSISTSVCSGTPFSVSPNDTQDGLVPSGTLYSWLAPTGAGLVNGVSQTTPVSAITGNLTNSTASLRFYLKDVWTGNLYSMEWEDYNRNCMLGDSVGGFYKTYYSFLSNSGGIKITRNDSAAIKGQFYFKGVSADGKVANISKGYFNIDKL